MELVDEAERAVAQLAARLLVERVDVAAGDLHDTRGRTVEPAEDLQQRGLAGARRTDDRQAFAGANAQVHALQHLQVDGPLAERALDARSFHDQLAVIHGYFIHGYFIHGEGPPPAACARRATRGR